MKRWCGAVFLALSLVTLRAEEDLPLPDNGPALEIEPPLLIERRSPDGTPDVPAPPEAVDVAKIETDLARAKRNAAAGERMYHAGIIAKVDSEERVLKVVRLEAKLAEAKLAAAKTKLDEQQQQSQVVEIEAQQRAVKSQVEEATRSAAEAANEQHRAEVESAVRNLARQKKLLALGSGRKSDVSRAAKKLAEVQDGPN
ncbi:MAG: hypothetical protein ABI992_05090 [Chthoniobacterales bacterium]